MFSYTKEQEEGIKTRNQDILISAAAGSGKTRVLVDRIVDMLIKDEILLSEMLIVTFTRAAAGEMKARLEKALVEAIAYYPQKEAIIERALLSLPKSHISTMHAYCINKLREYFYALDLSPKFDLLTGTEEALLKNQALEQVFDEAYEKGEQAFLDFISAYGGHRSDKKAIEMVLELSGFLSGVVSKEAWLEEALGLYENPSNEDKFLNLYRKNAKMILETSKENLEVMKKLLMELEEAQATLPYYEMIADDESQLRHLLYLLEDDIEAFFSALSAISFSRLPSSKIPKDLRERYETTYLRLKSLREEIKDSLKTFSEAFGGFDLGRIAEDRQRLYPYFLTLIQITKNYESAYQALKKEKNLLDFSDVEHEMLRLLADEKIKESLKKDTKYLFFDEYQDANPVQEAIVEALKGENNLFFVGDVKQAIYRFRLSDPAIFNARYKSYKADKDKGKLIFLSKNFRSNPNLLTFANFIFYHLMTESLGEVDYREKGQALVAGREMTTEESPIVLHLVEVDEEAEYDSEVLEIAMTIKALLKKGYRYKDIAILMRSPRARLKDFELVFQKYEIPYFTENSSVGFKNLEISQFLEVLKTISNQASDEALIATMLSPFGDFDEKELAMIRSANETFSFYEALLSYKAEDDLQKKLNRFLAQLSKWQGIFSTLPLKEASIYLFEESGYGAYLLARPRGKERYDNLLALFEVMGDYDRFSLMGLSGFLAYAETLIKEKADSLSPATSLSEADDCVRLMSIHKSKGLEFPVVLLADTAKRFNFQDSSKALVLESNLGMAMNVVDLEVGAFHKSFEKKVMSSYQNNLTKSEEVRLLYVALTRAVKEIHWFGKVKDKAKKLELILSKNTLSALWSANSYLDWLLAILAKDKVGSFLYSGEAFLPTEDYFNGKQAIVLSDILELMQKEETKKRPLPKIDENFKKALEARLYFKYPYLEEIKRAAKQTVSDLKKDSVHAYLEGLYTPSFVKTKTLSNVEAPKFLQGKKIYTAAEKGTILHKVLALIPLEDMDLDMLDLSFDNLILKGHLTSEEAEIIDKKVILDFLKSPLGKRIIKADTLGKVRREASFTMLYEESGVDGQIDLFFEEEGELVLLDFKSDKKKREESYTLQLSLYKKALEEAFEKPVKEVWLYWLSFNEATKLA